MIRVVCICGRAFKTDDRHAGKQTNCPECGAGLTIGPAPLSNSSGGDAKEAPAWWHPTDPGVEDVRATAPTRSSSDPGADAVNTMVLPPGYDPTTKPEPSSRAAAAGAQREASASKNTRGTQVLVLGGQSFPVKKVWAAAAATTAIVVLAIGGLVWLRSAPSGPDAIIVAQPASEPGQHDQSAPGKLPPSRSVPRTESGPSKAADSRTPGDEASRVAPASLADDDQERQRKVVAAGASRRLRLLVPAYIYPSGDGRKEWQRLFDAASKVEIVAIANPNSGPGTERSLDYAAIFTEASDQGITLVGYVSTDYGKRPQAEIKQDVDTWFRLYPQVRGFFFDQQPRDGRDVARFTELRNYVKGKLRDPLVITNPGIPCDEAYLAQAVSNVTCVFVNFQGFEQFELPAPLTAYEASRFAALPYNIPDIEAMRTIVKDAVIKRIGYLYISDAKPPNQWSKLPAYWEAEVDAVSRIR